jgi:hypothetical protein
MSLIQNLSKNETIRIYYKSEDFVPGLDVRFDFYRLSGVAIAENQPADGEIPDRGVYYYDFTAPNEDIYIVGQAHAPDDEAQEPIVFKVGNPLSQTLFYYTEKDDDSISYRIYDSLGVNQQSGILTNVPNTFFRYTTFSSDEDNYFFEVDDEFLARRFRGRPPSTVVIDAVTGTFTIIEPIVSGDALVIVNVFEGDVDVIPPPQDGEFAVVIFPIISSIIDPVLSGDALVEVNVFEGTVSTPGAVTGTLPPLVSSVIPPTVSGDGVEDAFVLEGTFTVNQPVVTGETTDKPQPPPSQGYPFDANLSLGAASAICGVVSGRVRRCVTIQFKICGTTNFECEEGIYQKDKKYDELISLSKICKENKKKQTIKLSEIKHNQKKNNSVIKIVKVRNNNGKQYNLQK